MTGNTSAQVSNGVSKYCADVVNANIWAEKCVEEKAGETSVSICSDGNVADGDERLRKIMGTENGRIDLRQIRSMFCATFSEISETLGSREAALVSSDVLTERSIS